jgi:mxaJ protein
MLFARSVGLSRARVTRIVLITALAAVALTLSAADTVARRHPRKGHPPAPRVLRVCADPNNLPFSNDRLEGFENKLATLIARELGATVRYTWWAQRRGFVRNTLNAGACDVVMGVPMSFERTLVTRPYYRSTYAFVYRRAARFRVTSFDDTVLRRLRVGVQLVGDDGANTPPAHALARRGIVDNVHGYTLYGDYTEPNPPARIVEAVANGVVDVAVVWGPLGGYFASRQAVPLAVVPVSPQIDVPFLPFVFDISVGVRRGNELLRDELDRVLRRRRPAVDSILDEFGVLRVDRSQRRIATSVPAKL